MVAEVGNWDDRASLTTMHGAPMIPPDQLGPAVTIRGAGQNDPNKSGRDSDLGTPRRHWQDFARRTASHYFGTLASTL